MTETMSREAKAAKAKYMREWRKHNREKLREYNANYWERKAAAAQIGESEPDKKV